nr:reverse transcriptase domain-containing protein [Tanacetum cinerariifolium]
MINEEIVVVFSKKYARRSKQPFNLKESPVDTMADQCTKTELIRVPTEGYAEAIVVPSILAEQFKLKNSLVNMMTLDQFFRLEKENPHDHIRCDANSSSSSEIDKLTHAVNQQTSVMTTAMTAILKQFQATPPPVSVKAVEDICVTCGGAHLYYQYIDSFNDIHPHFDDNPLSGSTTYSSNSLLEEFTDELALITYPPDYNDNLTCDIESNLREIEFLLYQGEDSILKDSIDQTDLANLDDYFVDPTPEMFTDEHAPDYSFPQRFDVYPNDFLEIESDADNFYDDPFDSKGGEIKESELLIDELDLPYDFLPYSEYDSFASQDFSRDDDLPSLDTENKVFNPGLLIHEKSVTIITRIAQEKKLAIYFASLVFKDFDPLLYELLVFKEVPNSMRLLRFSSKNEEKVFKPGIYTSEKVYSCFLLELSHPGYHVFKVN